MLHCPCCSRDFPESSLLWKCHCGSYLVYHPEKTGPIDENLISTRPHDMWRYREVLPLGKGLTPVSMGEGMTPLIKADWEGREVLFKLDYLCPTGSYKDRGMAYLVSRLVELGVDQVVEDSSGNAGASMAAYCGRAGIGCEIFVPDYTSAGKCVQIEMYGARLRRIPGTREDTTRAAEREAESVYYASHNWSPYFVHGIKTFAYEIWEQLGWKVPDNVVLPAGQGSLVMAARLGFQELFDAGKIPKLPKIFAVQSANCAPLFEAFRRGERIPAKIEKRETIAEGISSAEPVKGDLVLSDVRSGGGKLLKVEEKDIWEGFLRLCALGFYVEPTSAVVGAALDELFGNGLAEEGTITVALLTGSGLKATDKILHYREKFGP